jgi:hypothetical protein
MADTEMPMADTRPPVADAKPVSPLAHGIAVFAGVIMIIAGAFQAIEGLAGILNDEYLVVLPNYFLAFDITLWGWLHLLIGLALLAIGVSVLRGATWARVAGMVLAGISALLNFIWLPYSPWWSLLVIAIDILVIWALANYHREPATQGTRAATS